MHTWRSAEDRHGVGNDPDGLAFFLRRMARDYAPGLPLYVTENGMANADRVDAAGDVSDPERLSYFAEHLAAWHRAG